MTRIREEKEESAKTLFLCHDTS